MTGGQRAHQTPQIRSYWQLMEARRRRTPFLQGCNLSYAAHAEDDLYSYAYLKHELGSVSWKEKEQRESMKLEVWQTAKGKRRVTLLVRQK